jgi:hypothetical protein
MRREPRRRSFLLGVVLVAAIAAIALGGCAVLVSTSGLSGGDAEGGAPTIVTEAEAGEAGIVADARDASAFVPCAVDGAATALRVFDPIADKPDATPPCKSGNVLVTDDKGTGLDVLDYGQFESLAGTLVTSCVGVEFAAPLTTVTVRLRAVANACGRACMGTTCGTGRFAVAFLGATRDTLRLTGGDVNVTGAFENYPLSTKPTDRVAVVCRFASSADKDDIEVDSILGGCQP